MPHLFRPSRAAAVLSVLSLLTGSALWFPRSALASNPTAVGPTQHLPACPAAPAGYAHCHAILALPAAGGPRYVGSSPAGYNPADLQSAYKLPSSTGGRGQTIALVDAYDDRSAESDLAVYRAQFGLPPCTTANGCFHQVSQTGTSALPHANAGWIQETSLDLDMASAVCPNCTILLIEASSDKFPDLFAAVDYASAHAAVVSLSWSGPEFAGETADDVHLHRPGIAITASSGDNGYGVQYPAASPYVTAVGGTSLRPAANTRGWSEVAWGNAGSGCSAYEPKPAWQSDSGCANRTVADVSAVADPGSGVSVYDSTAYHGASGWLVFGGTSVSAPIIAGVYALAGNAATTTAASYPYTHLTGLFDVTGGANSTCGTYLCTSLPGYDGPTGLGTPNGTAGF